MWERLRNPYQASTYFRREHLLSLPQQSNSRIHSRRAAAMTHNSPLWHHGCAVNVLLVVQRKRKLRQGSGWGAGPGMANLQNICGFRLGGNSTTSTKHDD